MFKKRAVLISFFIFCQSVHAEEAGYREALEYFIYRKNQKQKEKGNFVEKIGEQGLQEFLPEAYKVFLSLGGGENLDSNFYSLEVGGTVLAGEYLQQSVSLEYNRILTEGSDAFKAGGVTNKFATAVFLNHSISLSSRKFYFSPELSMGIGRVFDDPNEGALIILKPGVVFSNRWGSGLLYSAHIYYRRNQYFSKTSHGDGLGFSLRVSY